MFSWLPRNRVLPVLFVLIGLNARADAGLVIDIGSTTLAPGQTGFVDVFITATANTDNLQAFGVKFQISTLPTRQLWFSSPVTDPQLTDPNYVFASTGSAAMTTPPAGSLSGDSLTYVGLDVSNSPAGVDGTFTRLLARLNLTTLTSFAPTDGDVFTISLVNDPDTAFYNAADPLTPLSYQAHSGTVTVSAIPEPSSLLLASLGFGSIAVARKRRRRLLQSRSIAGLND